MYEMLSLQFFCKLPTRSIWKSTHWVGFSRNLIDCLLFECDSGVHLLCYCYWRDTQSTHTLFMQMDFANRAPPPPATAAVAANWNWYRAFHYHFPETICFGAMPECVMKSAAPHVAIATMQLFVVVGDSHQATDRRLPCHPTCKKCTLVLLWVPCMRLENSHATRNNCNSIAVNQPPVRSWARLQKMSQGVSLSPQAMHASMDGIESVSHFNLSSFYLFLHYWTFALIYSVVSEVATSTWIDSNWVSGGFK